MQKHVNCGAFGSVDKITCHIVNLVVVVVLVVAHWHYIICNRIHVCACVLVCMCT